MSELCEKCGHMVEGERQWVSNRCMECAEQEIYFPSSGHGTPQQDAIRKREEEREKIRRAAKTRKGTREAVT
mgnify:CR=1